MANKLSGIVAIVGVVLISGCSSQTNTPALAGPSALATSIRVTATPDSLTQDGASQSGIGVLVTDANGRAYPNLGLRVDMAVGGSLQDYGALSARNIFTGSDGKAQTVYTAPLPPPALAGGTTTTVTILVTVVGTNSEAAGVLAGNASTAAIRLVPPGVILPPADTPTPAFTISPSPVNLNVPSVYDASSSCPGAADKSGACQASTSRSITSYAWNFGDGATGSSKSVSHTFTTTGTFNVTLTVTNDRGIQASSQQQVPVSASAGPTASFVFSPTAPIVSQSVVFNADASRAAPGHTLVQYSWIWGDGKPNDSGFQTSHTFDLPGTYNVTLTVADDTGQKATTNSAVVVGSGNPTAIFTFSQASPGAQVIYDASASTVAPDATIQSYAWTFPGGAPTSSSAVTQAVTYVAGTYTATLTVTDSKGRKGFSTQSVTVK